MSACIRVSAYMGVMRRVTDSALLRKPQWVRNLRVAGTGELRVGKHTEAFRGRELTDDEKVPMLRAYLKRWKAEVGIFFEGVGPDSTDEQIRAVAPKHPAFEVLPPQDVR